MEETKKRVRRSVEERAAELDKKIQAHKEAIKLLEEKKAELFRPKKRRRSDAEIAKDLLAWAKKAGMTSKDIAEKLGLEME
ncbi:MAG: hypothetical protein HFF10_07295 [Angelakisella sp.]|nr:hypothetical protein [Angelakisella sp.]